jgi:hypothetical protein
MKKLTLLENDRQEFIDYAKNRINKSIKPLNYLTNNILHNTFTFFVNHKLTVEANARSYWYKNNKKEIECFGYSGRDINFRDDEEGIRDNLYHEIFCKAEWIARSNIDGYIQTVKGTIGIKNYKSIVA